MKERLPAITVVKGHNAKDCNDPKQSKLRNKDKKKCFKKDLKIKTSLTVAASTTVPST